MSSYIGMDRNSGQTLGDLEHIRQSVRDILITPIGSRVMRRDYGSLLSALIDQPQSPAVKLQVMARVTWRCCAGNHVSLTLTGITLESTYDGKLAVNIAGALTDGPAFSLSVPVS